MVFLLRLFLLRLEWAFKQHPAVKAASLYPKEQITFRGLGLLAEDRPNSVQMSVKVPPRSRKPL